MKFDRFLSRVIASELAADVGFAQGDFLFFDRFIWVLCKTRSAVYGRLKNKN